MRSRYLAVTLLLVTHGPYWRAIFLSSKSSRDINYINSFCVLSNIMLYCSAIYRESMVFHEDQINTTQIARFMGPTWGPPGSCRPQMGPMLAPWTLLPGMVTRALGANDTRSSGTVMLTVWILVPLSFTRKVFNLRQISVKKRLIYKWIYRRLYW